MEDERGRVSEEDISAAELMTSPQSPRATISKSAIQLRKTETIQPIR